MQVEMLKNLVQEIRSQKTERQTIELKSCAGGFPKKIYDTLSSFSNQDEGGIIIFGMADKPDYEVVGVYDAEDTQKKIMENCNQMEPKVRPLITVGDIDGKAIVAAEIPGVDASLRPVFYAGVGRVKGSYVRVGDRDEPMTEYEVYSYEVFRVTYNDHPTLAGVMFFSMYPQTHFPQLCVTAVVVPGTEIGDTGSEGERFIDNKRITGSIPDMLEDTVKFIRRNSRTKTIIDTEGRRVDKPEYPMKAVREAVFNALVHRDYSVHTENTPVSIEMYRDRLVIRSSGGLYGSMSLQSLGKARPETRNAVLANILELLKVTENRYSGIPTIRKELENAGLPEPEFSVRHGEVTVVFRNSIFQPENEIDRSDMVQAILEFCKKPRSRQEIVNFAQKSRYYVMSTWVQPLVEQGVLRMTIPDKPKSSKQKFVKV